MSLSTVQWWVRRAAGERLDRVDWEDHPTGCRPAVNRLAVETEELVLRLRRELKATSDLGEYGAVAIHRELLTQGPRVGPSVLGGCWSAGAPWMVADDCDTQPRRPAGICRPWPGARRNSTASTSWQGW